MSTARRGKGEGTIGRRPDGSWWGRIDLGYRDGRRVRKAFYGPTREDVARKMTAALRDVHRGLPVVIGDQTLKQFLLDWLAHSVEPHVRPTTFRSYEQAVRLHLIPGIGHIRLQRLTPQALQAWMTQHVEDGASPQTVAYARRVLRIALGQAQRWSLVARNVATLVKPPRAPRRSITPLDPIQAQTFLTATADHRLAALFSVALACGLREGEALGLKWDAVDLDAGTLEVRTTLQRVGKRWIWGEPKSDRGRRVVRLPTICVTALRRHRARQLEERLKAGQYWEDYGLVFSTRTGGPLHPRNVLRDFQRLLAQAGLPKIRFHDLRHSCATLLLAQGVSPRVVMDVLGHSQVSLTLNTYSHVLPALQREAADRIDAILGGGKP